MSRLKTFLKYVIWIVVFAVLSELLINASLKSSYADITRKDTTAQVEITQAQATLVNGKIKGTIKDDRKDSLTGKYVEIKLYSSRDNEVGKRYIQIQTTDVNQTQDFNFYFEKNDVKSYKISIVNEKEEGELEIFPKEMSRAEIFVATLFTMMMVL
ncbi:MAG: hypothetical protein EGQ16_04000 [Clostridiales bacterium]|nr:hypothetical protein [Clostridiales bacterium]